VISRVGRLRAEVDRVGFPTGGAAAAARVARSPLRGRTGAELALLAAPAHAAVMVMVWW